MAKYGLDNFRLYILEILESSEYNNVGQGPQLLSDLEDYRYRKIQPTYNSVPIYLPLHGEQHPLQGKAMPLEVKEKIRATHTGRVIPLAERASHVEGARKNPTYCYDAETIDLLMSFPGQRIIARAFNLSNSLLIRRKLDNNKIFSGTLDGKDTIC